MTKLPRVPESVRGISQAIGAALFCCGLTMASPGALVVSVDPAEFGASASEQSVSCTASASSNLLACSEIADFRVGQGIMLRQMGPPPHSAVFDMTPAPMVKQVGAGRGQNTYCYVVAVGDPFHGVQPPSPPSCLAGQPTLSFDHYHQVWLPEGFHASVHRVDRGRNLSRIIPIYLWYVSLNGGPYRLMYMSAASDPRTDYVHMGEDRPNGSFGGWPDPLPDQGQPNGALRNADLFSTIKRITRTASGYLVRLADDAAQSSASALMAHDDTAAVQLAIDRVASLGGGTVQLGAGTYRLQRPTFSTGLPQHPYTTDVMGREGLLWWLYAHILHLDPSHNRHVHIAGTLGGTDALTNATTIDTGEGIPFGSLLHIRARQLDAAGRPGHIAGATFAMAPADKGAYRIRLSTPADAARLRAGDDIWLFSGNFSPLAPQDARFKPCITEANGATGGCHFSELNTITAINASSGDVFLTRPITKKYWADGHNSFGFVRQALLPHDIAIEHLNLATQHAIFSPESAAFDVALDGVQSLYPNAGNHLGTGYKRGLSVTNSTLHLGAGSMGWSGTNELDQVADVVLANNDVIGYGAPGAEGPSLGARLFFTEGACNITITGNRFSNVQLLFQQADDVLVDKNVFHNAVVWADASERSPNRTTVDWGFLSFASQHRLQISDNDFDLDGPSLAGWVIMAGDFDDARIERNRIRYAASNPSAWMIYAASGTVAANTIHTSAQPMARQAPIHVGSVVQTRPLYVQNNLLAGRYAWAVAVEPNAASTTNVCIKGNFLNGKSADQAFTLGPAAPRPASEKTPVLCRP